MLSDSLPWETNYIMPNVKSKKGFTDLDPLEFCVINFLSETSLLESNLKGHEKLSGMREHVENRDQERTYTRSTD